jgi:predicted ATPase
MSTYHYNNFLFQIHHILKDIKRDNSEMIFTFLYISILSFLYFLIYDEFKILYSGRVGNEYIYNIFKMFCDFC